MTCVWLSYYHTDQYLSVLLPHWPLSIICMSCYQINQFLPSCYNWLVLSVMLPHWPVSVCHAATLTSLCYVTTLISSCISCYNTDQRMYVMLPHWPDLSVMLQYWPELSVMLPHWPIHVWHVITDLCMSLLSSRTCAWLCCVHFHLHQSLAHWSIPVCPVTTLTCKCLLPDGGLFCVFVFISSILSFLF